MMTLSAVTLLMARSMAVSASPRLTPRMVAFWETAAVIGRSSARRRTRRIRRSSQDQQQGGQERRAPMPRRMSGIRRWSARACERGA